MWGNTHDACCRTAQLLFESARRRRLQRRGRDQRLLVGRRCRRLGGGRRSGLSLPHAVPARDRAPCATAHFFEHVRWRTPTRGSGRNHRRQIAHGRLAAIPQSSPDRARSTAKHVRALRRWSHSREQGRVVSRKRRSGARSRQSPAVIRHATWRGRQRYASPAGVPGFGLPIFAWTATTRARASA